MCFSTDFWNERYQNEKTAWDIKYPSTPLKEYIYQIDNKELRILIPGCGNAYEAEYLIEQGFTNITLIDISDVLVESLKNKFVNTPQITILNQDFFDLQGEFDLIIEQTFFCAIDPNLRTAYVDKMESLLSENGRLVGVLFNIDFNNPFPPFGGNKEEYEQLFRNKFKFKHFEVAYNSIKPRSGNELFICLLKV